MISANKIPKYIKRTICPSLIGMQSNKLQTISPMREKAIPNTKIDELF